jgi:hypothetical protein
MLLRNVLQLLVSANVVPSSLIVVTLMIEAIIPPKRRCLQEPYGVIPEDGIHHSHRRENLKSYIVLTVWAL